MTLDRQCRDRAASRPGNQQARRLAHSQLCGEESDDVDPPPRLTLVDVRVRVSVGQLRGRRKQLSNESLLLGAVDAEPSGEAGAIGSVDVWVA